jgi:tRNA uridine 5-carboxymethylaminomethyl modification enzyme
LKEFDVIVIGAGHAGCEAALASARLGLKTAIITINLDNIALMSCNPSIGGPAKGHLVAEIDALGGEMARNIDKSFIQIRVLNTKKGPAVQALRAQADKELYKISMKTTLENQKNLSIVQGLVTDLIVEDLKIKAVKTKENIIYKASKVILATGTFMRGLIHMGSSKFDGGRMSEPSSKELPVSLEKLGIKMGRFKTGTPPRVSKNSVDFTSLIEQPGDDIGLKFSKRTDISEVEGREQLSCFLTHTNAEVHNLIKDNLSRSPMFNGDIESKGPRYCPSVEDKVNKFQDKDRHQVFLEPEGRETSEIYLNGLSTSLPANVQESILKKIPGLEKSEIMRYGYAVEYDYILPESMKYDLESRDISGLYFCGQINGTTGYEEAASTGLIAGINAALSVKGKEPLILERNSSYIGLMIDDLITKGTIEPYRVLTARSECRLILRYDNADIRLSEIGYRIGLLDKKYYDQMIFKRDKCRELRNILKNRYVSMNDDRVSDLVLRNNEVLKSGVSLENLLKRPNILYKDIKYIEDLEDLPEDIEKYIETEIKYEGYIAIQKSIVDKYKNIELKPIPQDFDYNLIQNISTEAKERLKTVRPINMGQASKISGVNPSDISFLMLYLETKHAKTTS